MKIKDAESDLRLGNNFPLNCSQHQRPRLSLISIPRPNINTNWQYGNNVTLNAYLSSRMDTVHKNWSQSGCIGGKTSNMFTYISEQHPSVQIRLCPVYNLMLKPYDFCDAEWIQNPVMTMNVQYRCHIKRSVWWTQSCQITTWSSVCDY